MNFLWIHNLISSSPGGFLIMLYLTGAHVYLQEIGEFVGVMGIDVSVSNIQNVFQKHNVS